MPSPYVYDGVVKEAWLDDNGHMNVAYYMLAFDMATDALFDHIDLGEAYKNKYNFSTFTLEAHITYDREVLEGDPLRFKTTVLDYDEKRLHYFHEIFGF